MNLGFHFLAVILLLAPENSQAGPRDFFIRCAAAVGWGPKPPPAETTPSGTALLELIYRKGTSTPTDAEIAKAVRTHFLLFPDHSIFVRSLVGSEVSLVRTGAAYSYPDTLKAIFNTLSGLPSLVERGHGALLFYPTTSASLLSYLPFGIKPHGTPGRIIPIDSTVLGRVGAALFEGGTIPVPVAPKGTSRVLHLIDFEHALNIALKHKGWTPRYWNKLRELEIRPEGSHLKWSPIILLNEERARAWTQLDSMEQRLVSEAFPVVFGLRPKKKSPGRLRLFRSEVQEVGLEDGFGPEETAVIFVPAHKIAGVQGILRDTNSPLVRDIKIEPVEPLLQEQKRIENRRGH